MKGEQEENKIRQANSKMKRLAAQEQDGKWIRQANSTLKGLAAQGAASNKLARFRRDKTQRITQHRKGKTKAKAGLCPQTANKPDYIHPRHLQTTRGGLETSNPSGNTRMSQTIKRHRTTSSFESERKTAREGCDRSGRCARKVQLVLIISLCTFLEKDADRGQTSIVRLPTEDEQETGQRRGRLQRTMVFQRSRIERERSVIEDWFTSFPFALRYLLAVTV